VRNKIIILTVALLFFPLCLYAWEGNVISVTDGDTIKVLKDGKQVKIRLALLPYFLWATSIRRSVPGTPTDLPPGMQVLDSS
jgi:hypothetical protein